MNTQILLLSERIRDAWDGDPWFGRNIRELLDEVDGPVAIVQPEGQHSILELVLHMAAWKEFTISRMKNDGQPLAYFEEIDWRPITHTGDASLQWASALDELNRMHEELLELLQQQEDAVFLLPVPGKSYTYRNLLFGILEHDIYHAGQVAYVKKLVQHMV